LQINRPRLAILRVKRAAYRKPTRPFQEKIAMHHSRREFLADVGKGMLIAGVGSAVAGELGLGAAWADESPGRLTFGSMEPLVSLMEDTPAGKLLPALVEKLKAGTDVRTFTAAAALANARTFGGNDYVGYHSFMALVPAYQMSRELPAAQQPLPVLKVLYRNTSRIQGFGGRGNEMLHEVKAMKLAGDRPAGESLRDAVRRKDQKEAEAIFAAIAAGPANEAFNHLQFAIEDEVDVHRVVLAWRAWAMLDLTGRQQAHTLLRQSVRFCIDSECHLEKYNRPGSAIRTLLPKLLDQYRLVGRPLGDRKADDAWIEEMCRTVYGAGRERAADAVAAALADGISPESVGEAISLAANRLVLCDPGRKRAEEGKPIGSIHGASVGVHASDSANAWRNIARVSNQRNTVASLIVGAFHTAGQNNGQIPQPYPSPEHQEKIRATDASSLLRETEAAIKEKNQGLVCALVDRYGREGHPVRPIFDLMLRYGMSEDGALHAEKYYRTVTEEFDATRAAFRWRHMVGLARVTASEYGFPAPGYAEACRLLNV
jgi:hypothetical protein